MRSTIVFSLTFCLATILATNIVCAVDLKPDLEKSKINFVGGKPDGTTHAGGFKKFEIKANADFEDPSKSTIRIEIMTESLFSDDEKLTAHLKNPDFFDVRKFPKAVFESTSIEHGDAGTATIVGKLKMLDKVVEVKVPVALSVTEEVVTMVGKFKIDRTKWGMDYGKGKINDDVEMSINLVLKR